MAQVMKASSMDLSKISFSEPKKGGGVSGFQIVFVNYDGTMNPLYVQSPKVETTWDSKYFEDNESSGKYNVQFSLPDVGTNDQNTAFHGKMDEFDKFMIDTAYNNRTTWFKSGKKLSKETIETLYTPMIKVSTDSETGEPNGRWPPSFKFKIKKKDNKHECSVYDSSKTPFNIEDREAPDYVDLVSVLVKGSTMNVILKCTGVWLINNKFGVSWTAEQVMVTTKPSTTLTGCAFIDDDGDDDEASNNVADVADAADDDDAADEADNDDEDEPAPEPVKVKKVRRVKKSSD